jgi:16S rRNA (cytidine1402-2'-O)-methyltransferase
VNPEAAGSLVLVPAPLDFGVSDGTASLAEQLPLGSIQHAARLRYWLVENAKSARAFLKRVQALTPLAAPLQELAMQELPRPSKGGNKSEPVNWQALLAPALAGNELGLLSEAGLPAVADPGAAAVAHAHALGLRVEVLPGASALTLALAASGLNGQQFAFVGYLPQDAVARTQRLRELETTSARLQQTQLFIETPYRNVALLDAALSCLKPGTRLALAQALATPQAHARMLTVAKWRGTDHKPSDQLPCVFAILA